MSMFTKAEQSYLTSQQVGRLATVGADGQPHVVPVLFRYDATHDTIDIGGPDLPQSKKYRDAQHSGRVALVVDDFVFVPGQVRGIEIRGDVEVVDRGGALLGPGYADPLLRISPRRVVSWGVEQVAQAVA
ncbi:MAG: PPOX class F420-dependent oxidoreductase [Candidatus Nanopelagicales bacterium]